MKMVNLLPNLNRVDVGNISIWFSYETPIAFEVGKHEMVVHENVWSRTTAKHLNHIDGGKENKRVSEEVFNALWKEQLPKELQ